LLIFPLVYTIRKLKSNADQSDMRPVHPVINTILTYTTAAEMHFRRLNQLCGVTCVAEGGVYRA
jgi:hypothetical protein